MTNTVRGTRIVALRRRADPPRLRGGGAGDDKLVKGGGRGDDKSMMDGCVGRGPFGQLRAGSSTPAARPPPLRMTAGRKADPSPESTEGQERTCLQGQPE